MNIGIDARYLGMADTALGRYAEGLLAALARRDHDNDYVVYVHANLQRKLRLGENFRIVPIRGNPSSIGGMRRIWRAARREEFDLFHALFPLAPPWLDCPLLLTAHDSDPFSGPTTATAWQRLMRLPWMWFFHPLALRRARWVVCVSRSTRFALTALFPDLFHKTIVVHSGVDEAFRSPIEAPTLELIRSRLELPRPFLFYSGSARANKNIVPMLRAFAQLRQRSERWENLWLVLDVPEGDYSLAPITRAIQQFDLGERVLIHRGLGEEERRALYEEASAFVIFSRAEGFGTPVLEAQLCGLPVIAVDAGALPEVAGEDGAVYINPDDSAAAAEMIERVLTDETLRAYLIEQGRENARKYDWTTSADKIVGIYELLFFPRGQVQTSSPGGLVPRLTQWLGL